jgi:hypothetical protein
MDWFAGEPTLDETLSDPVVQAVMKRDDVDLDCLRKFLEDIGGRLGESADREPDLAVDPT